MKFLTVNGKIQVRNGKPITVPNDYNNSLIKIGNNLVKTSTGLIGKKPGRLAPGYYKYSNGNYILGKSWNELISEGMFAVNNSYLNSLSTPHYAFEKIVLPDGITHIDINTFKEDTWLAIVDVPDSLTNICSNAFNGCTALYDINLPDALETIGGGAFYRCITLHSIDIPSNVSKIGADAFGLCESLETVNIPTGVKYCEINDMAFAGCSSLTNITLPARVILLGNNIFKDCENLTITLSRNYSEEDRYAPYGLDPSKVIYADGRTHAECVAVGS